MGKDLKISCAANRWLAGWGGRAGWLAAAPCRPLAALLAALLGVNSVHNMKILAAGGDSLIY
eukprot:COSAG01_NODE_49698_length_369_cov_38.644444_1_plen_62_part_00